MHLCRLLTVCTSASHATTPCRIDWRPFLASHVSLPSLPCLWRVRLPYYRPACCACCAFSLPLACLSRCMLLGSFERWLASVMKACCYPYWCGAACVGQDESVGGASSGAPL